ncbi:4Fe-4S dicluster domain-containing protein [bacterium]|nr:4Fe-4S dicluster domain-containing protein [bacterium]
MTINNMESGKKSFSAEMDERGPVVFGPVDGPFERPAEKMVEGNLYMETEEVVPEVAPRESEAEQKDAARKALAMNIDRRDFLKLFGATAVASSAACVRRPAEKAIPYVNQPVDFVPSVGNEYATTCGECAAGCGVVVRTLEGRPVKIEGNREHPISQGGTCTLGQAALQGLYHLERRKGPSIKRANRVDNLAWDDVYELLAKDFAGKKVGILTGGSTGNRHQFYREWLRATGSSESRLYTYESNALYATMAQAHAIAFGFEALPRIDLRQVNTVVGIGSDFLDVGVSPVYFAKSFSEARGLKGGNMARLVQFESAMTNTGGRADERHVIAPNAELITTLLLMKSLSDRADAKGSANAKAIAKKILATNANVISGGYEAVGVEKSVFDTLATDMIKSPSVLFAGGSHSFDDQATALQVAAIVVNELAGAYGTALMIDRGWMVSPVKAGDMKRFVDDARGLDALVIIDTNPSFTLPASFGFDALVKKIPLVVSMQTQPVETDDLATYVLPMNHYLESWGDEQPAAGFWSARQPAVLATTDSRQAEDALLWIAAHMKRPMPYSDYRAYIRERWKAVAALVDSKGDFENFFNAVLRRGFVGKLASRPADSLRDVASSVKAAKLPAAGTLRLLAPIDVRLNDGRGANKPVLQETGDAMTTIAWDTWVALNPGTAKKMGLRRNDLLKVETDAGTVEAALYPLPGVHADAVVIHRGNGHAKHVSKISGGNGVNPLALFAKATDAATGMPVTSGATVKLASTGKIFQLAAMQKHNDLANRHDIVKKLSVAQAAEKMAKVQNLDDVPDLYPALYDNVEHRWGLSVDLTKCTGCGACQVACAQENNVPQVGREQVNLHRVMHWIRLDRYFEGDTNNPQVSIQPMMCQQCSHAPCEAVCPVFATTHHEEGINSMTYNRCIGTRYCANACPYKVRRFNWWTHKWNTIGDRLQDRNIRALNPDVTVRTRGVMEKCNFCFQRIRDAKHAAKVQKRKVMDGEIRTACEQVCPSDAIVFGNLKDPNSRVSKLRADGRSYLALGGDPEAKEFGLKTLPNVSYMAHVSHREGFGESLHSEHGAPGSHNTDAKTETHGNQEEHKGH